MAAFAIVLGIAIPIALFVLFYVWALGPHNHASTPPIPSTQEHILAALRAARELDEGDLEALAATLYVPVPAPIRPMCESCGHPATMRLASRASWETWTLCDLHERSWKGHDCVKELLP